MRRDFKCPEYDNDLGFREGAGMLEGEGCGDRARRLELWMDQRRALRREWVIQLRTF